jgi:hypothetical protein
MHTHLKDTLLWRAHPSMSAPTPQQALTRVASDYAGTPWRVFNNEARKHHPNEQEDSLLDLQSACKSMFLAQVMRDMQGAGMEQDSDWPGSSQAKLTDMVFLLSDGTRIRGHKGFLSARSAYIHAAFASGMQESRTNAIRVRSRAHMHVSL